MDFVLWKPSKPGEPAWESPCGIAAKGRPGWHIECSAMADRWLWQEPQMKGLLSEAGLKQPHVFDIHAGGIDLVFPHHENEVAQSRCAHGTPVMANYWLHNGFLQVEGEKMSKSLGNFVTIHELLSQCAGDVIRLSMILTHYRQPIDWTTKGLAASQSQFLTWADYVAYEVGENADLRLVEGNIDKAMIDAISDDLNTPLAIARLHEVFAIVKSGRSPIGDFVRSAQFLGFRHLNKPGYFHPHINANMFESGPQASEAEQEEILAYRSAVANGRPDVAQSIVGVLEAKGFELKINAAGVVFVGNKTSAEMIDLEDRLRLEVEALIAKRHLARKAKDFAAADEIRRKLSERGIQLKDAKDPATGEIVTTWEVKR
jgi:cysteinyl-tRNA synthetase